MPQEQIIVTSAGLNLAPGAGNYPTFRITHFQPVYDYRYDNNIHTDGSVNTSAIPLNEAQTLSDGFAEISGEKFWNLPTTDGTYSLSETDGYVYRNGLTATGVNLDGTDQSSSSQVNTWTESATGSSQELLTSAYYGTVVSNTDGDFEFASAPTAISQTSYSFPTSADRDSLFDTVTYSASKVDPDTGLVDAIFTAKFPLNTGTFKFNKVVFYIQELIEGTEDVDLNLAPVPFAYVMLDTVIVKNANSVMGADAGLSEFEIQLRINFDVTQAEGLYFEPINQWQSIPLDTGVRGLEFSEHVSINESGNGNSWEPLAKLHITSTSATQLRLSNVYENGGFNFKVLDEDTVDSYGISSDALTIINSNDNGNGIVVGTLNSPNSVQQTEDKTNGGKRSSVIGGGNNNVTNSDDSIVLGGSSNSINNLGNNNAIVGTLSSSIYGVNTASVGDIILGGQNQYIKDSVRSSVVGGIYNSLEYGTDSIVMGGEFNKINTSTKTAIVGGDNNEILSSTKTTIIGGEYNNVSGNSTDGAIVGGVSNNLISTNYSTIHGGGDNTVQNNSSYTSILGGYGCVSTNTTYSAIVGGNGNDLTDSLMTTMVGGSSNSATDVWYASVVGGRRNHVTTESNYSSIVGGLDNIIENTMHSTQAGGYNNVIRNSSNLFVGGGHDLTAYGTDSAMIGGYRNSMGSSSSQSIVIGGYSNDLNSSMSAIIASHDCVVFPTGGYGLSLASSESRLQGDRSTLLSSRSSGAYGYNSVIMNSANSSTYGKRSTVIAGYDTHVGTNTIDCEYSIAVGYENNITGFVYGVDETYATNNVNVSTSSSVEGSLNTIIGGENNTVVGRINNTMIGGRGNSISPVNDSFSSSKYVTSDNYMIGGFNNIGYGASSGVIGGYNNYLNYNPSNYTGLSNGLSLIVNSTDCISYDGSNNTIIGSSTCDIKGGSHGAMLNSELSSIAHDDCALINTNSKQTTAVGQTIIGRSGGSVILAGDSAVLENDLAVAGDLIVQGAQTLGTEATWDIGGANQAGIPFKFASFELAHSDYSSGAVDINIPMQDIISIDFVIDRRSNGTTNVGSLFKPTVEEPDASVNGLYRINTYSNASDTQTTFTFVNDSLDANFWQYSTMRIHVVYKG